MSRHGNKPPVSLDSSADKTKEMGHEELDVSKGDQTRVTTVLTLKKLVYMHRMIFFFSDRSDDTFLRLFFEMSSRATDQLLKISSDFFADKGTMRCMAVDVSVTWLPPNKAEKKEPVKPENQGESRRNQKQPGPKGLW